MSTQENPKAAPAARGAVMPAADVIAIVREWVDLHARALPDFAGAYLWGGITALAADAPFDLYRDVDVVVVLTHGRPTMKESFSTAASFWKSSGRTSMNTRMPRPCSPIPAPARTWRRHRFWPTRPGY
ncbi:MAG: hypothetical protein IPK19_39505 [Chloroflexi bacterium]|nr:hypothetical protein [Chloroflexota bacterium]